MENLGYVAANQTDPFECDEMRSILCYLSVTSELLNFEKKILLSSPCIEKYTITLNQDWKQKIPSLNKQPKM